MGTSIVCYLYNTQCGWSTRYAPQRTCALPIRVTVQRALGPRSTLPLPTRDTVAGPPTGASIRPDPALATWALAARRPGACKLPEPPRLIDRLRVEPRAVTLPEPPIDTSARSTATSPIARLPDPPTAAAKLAPLTRSTVIRPEPPSPTAVKRGTVIVKWTWRSSIGSALRSR